MPDQQPGEAEFAEAWPALRERWLSEGLPIEQFVRAAYLAGFAARKAQLQRLAYSPEGIDELRAEHFQVQYPGPIPAPGEQSPGWRGTVTGRSSTPAMQYFHPYDLPEPLPMDGPGRPRNPGETDHRYLMDPEPYTGPPTREDTRLMAAVEGEEQPDPGHEGGKEGGNAS